MAKKQHTQFGTDAQSELKIVFTEFIDNCENNGLDEFYYSVIGNNKNFHELWRIMNTVFIVVHGNACIESGFSVNGNILVDNLEY